MDDYEEDTNEDIKWRTLGPKDRVKFLKNLFSDADWYDGSPFFEGGDTNPDFHTICDRSGAPMAEVKRYYASWLDRQGFDPKRAMQLDKDKNQSTSSMQTPPSAQHTFNQQSNTPQQLSPMMDSQEQDPMENMMMRQMEQGHSKGGSESSNMMFMMHFLTSQQRMQMQQQQWQSQLMMQQRQGDQQREADMRREQMARDQQFMNHSSEQMTEASEAKSKQPTKRK